MKTILIVGTSFHTLRDYLLAHGYEYVTLKDVRLAKNPEKRLKRRIVCDFSSPETIAVAVEELKNRYSIDGVIATYENYIRPAAEIATLLGLPGLPLSAAKACTDKTLMRRLFEHAPEKISPGFLEVNSEADVRDFAARHSFPLILKPANLSKSLLVSKSETLEELLANYRAMTTSINSVYAKYAPSTPPKVLIEEFLEGPIHSVDAFIDSAGTPHVLDAIVDYETGYDIGFDDNFHYSRLLPSRLSADEAAELRRIAAIGCQALGMKNSPAHIEIIRTKSGPRIVEIGARNGGYRERMHALANGLDITGNAVRLCLGEQPDVTIEKHEPVGVFELFPEQPGIFKGIEGYEQLKNLPSFTYGSIKATPGSYVGKAGEGYKMCAIVMLHHPDVRQFERDRKFLNESVRVITTR